MTRRQRVLAYASGGIGLGTNALVYFMVPLRASELGVGVGAIGLLLGLKGLTETALSVPLGAFIDRAGPRRAYLIGTGGVALAGLAFMLASSVAALFLLQFALGAVRPLAWVGGQAYVSGMRSGAERSYDTGRFSFSANVGQIIAPVLAGGAVELVGVRLAFAVIAVYGCVFFLVGLALPDVGRSAPAVGAGSTGFGAALRLLRIREIQVVMLLTFARLWLPSVWSSFLPLYLVGIGTSASIAGTAASFMAVVATLTSLLTGRIARLGRPAMVTATALGMSCAGVALSAVFTTVPSVYLPAALVGFGQGLSLPLLLVLVSAAAPAGQRSVALGLRSSVNQAAAAAAPTLVAPVIAVGGLSLGFPLAGAIGACILLAAVVLDRRGRKRGSSLSTR